MAQFQVYLLPGGPLVLDLQCDLIDTGTRVVAPLIPIAEGPRPLTRLEPVFEIGGAPHALHTAEMAAVRGGVHSGGAGGGSARSGLCDTARARHGVFGVLRRGLREGMRA